MDWPQSNAGSEYRCNVFNTFPTVLPTSAAETGFDVADVKST